MLNETLSENPSFDLKNGRALVARFRNRTVRTPYQDIRFDGDGIRKIDLAVKRYNTTTGELQVKADTLFVYTNFLPFFSLNF